MKEETNKLMKTAEAAPVASSLIETFRSIGYSFETALADIIDNSITAGATEIIVRPEWHGGNSFVTIVDNGCGMTNEELIQALVPGSKNPLSERSENDLGRFGLGLKTASFSQCRCLSVVSKKTGILSYWTWNLDHVASTNRWEIINWYPEEFKGILDKFHSGTAVIWTKVDRLVSPSTSNRNERLKRKFMEIMGKAEFHLSMVFHKFLQTGTFKLKWGEDKWIQPWDPFCMDEKPMPQSEECLNTGQKIFGTAKGYVLPTESNFSSPQKYSEAGGNRGWNNMQGFYIYRGQRLLVAADWLNIRRKELHSQLARIEVVIPNSMDELWQIDIKKSSATPPSEIKDQLATYARKICSLSESEFRQRRTGKKIGSVTTFEPLWIENVKSDKKWSFAINRNSSVLSAIKEQAKISPSKAIESLLKIIESTLPTRAIYIKESEASSKREEIPPVDIEAVKEIVRTLFANLCGTGISKKGAIAKIKNMEPINRFEQIIEEVCQ